MGDTISCSVYYKCEQVDQVASDDAQSGTAKSVWKTYSCENEYFDVIEKTCASIINAKVYRGCNRCQFTSGSLYWINDFDTKCSEYLTCSNGQKTNTGKCGEGNFFNEDIQYCMIGTATKDKYVENHGACAQYTCDDSNRVCTMENSSTK